MICDQVADADCYPACRRFRASPALVRIDQRAQPRTMAQHDPPELNDDPVEVSDSDLLAEYQRSGGEPSNPEVEGNLAEIQRRNLDF